MALVTPSGRSHEGGRHDEARQQYREQDAVRHLFAPVIQKKEQFPPEICGANTVLWCQPMHRHRSTVA